MKLQVPYYSQFRNVTNTQWQDGSCTMTCLKMALDFLYPQRAPSIDELFDEGLTHIKSMTERGLLSSSASAHGIPHEVVVLMAHNYGALSYREEFKSMAVSETGKVMQGQYAGLMYEQGLKKICAMLETGSLPIVSVEPGLSAGKSFHTILLVGFEATEGTLTGFYYHDPDAKEDPREGIFISLEDFRKFWRKMAIFIG